MGTHIGRKIERVRTLRGMKQETLAAKLGVTQTIVSRIEQSAQVDEEKLNQIAEALDVTPDTIKNFDENAALGNSNFYNPQFQDNATIVTNQFNPVEKIIELYERLLQEERNKNELLASQLREVKR